MLDDLENGNSDAEICYHYIGVEGKYYESYKLPKQAGIYIVAATMDK